VEPAGALKPGYKSHGAALLQHNKPPSSRKEIITQETDRYEQLREENTDLKKRHKQLEEEIRQVAVKLKRQVQQIKSDRAGQKSAKLAPGFSEDLDKLIEENLRLQEEERQLTASIKQIQIDLARESHIQVDPSAKSHEKEQV
jgi:chromosome segregation ATPase